MRLSFREGVVMAVNGHATTTGAIERALNSSLLAAPTANEEGIRDSLPHFKLNPLSSFGSALFQKEIKDLMEIEDSLV